MKILALILLTALPLCAQAGEKIIAAARIQIGITTSYKPDYVILTYPNGDVPREGGVCTDVIIRALRDGLSQDLQKLLNEDMRANFPVYPKNWGLSKPDKNIDHRRVPNLRTYFKRKGYEQPLPKAGDVSTFRPGDIVTCTIAKTLPHIMIVSDRKTPEGIPLVIHNIGGGAQEEDALTAFPLTGHFRWK